MPKFPYSRKLVIPGVIALAVLFLGNFNNPPNGRTGAPPTFSTCSSCHGTSTNGLDGEITIENFPSTITPNTTYSLTAKLTNPNGVAVRGGFQAVVLNETDGNTNAGDITVSGSNPSTTTVGGREYVEHSPGQNFPSNNEVIWDFDWIAPAGSNGDVIKIYLASVIANGNGGTSGDFVVTSVGTSTIDGGAIPLSIDIVFSLDVFCNGNNDGAAVVEASDGTPPYTYTWTNGETTATASNLSAGLATVTVTDASGASLTESILINEPSAPATVSIIDQTDITCDNPSGSATAEAVGGVGNYSYTWDTGDTGPVVSNLSAGTHGVTIFDGNGCGAEVSLVINEDINSPIADAGPSIEFNCNFNSVFLNGSASDAGNNITYLWTTSNGNIVSGETSAGPMVDLPGTYTITVTNNTNGCTSSASTVVTQTPNLNSSISGNDLICSNINNGSINLTVNGGSQPYSYDWTGTAYDGIEDPTNLPAGTYTVTITDDDGCTEINSVSILAPAAIIITETIDNVTCNGACDGSINVTASGGSGTYTYSWTNGATTPNINNLCPGNYTVVVTDGNGCSEEATFTVGDVSAISITGSTTMTFCNGLCAGTINTTVSGGTVPYTYQWSPSGTNDANPTGLCAGDHIVTVTDSNGCIAISSFTINQPPVLTVNVVTTNETSVGANDGTADADLISSGTAPYTYLWNNNFQDQTLTGLAPGIYCVTVTDFNGCTVSSCGSVAGVDCDLAGDLVPTNVACFGGNDGMAVVNLTGGTLPVSYSWSTSSNTTNVETGLAAGTHSVTITDAEDCELVITYDIGQPDQLEAELETTQNTSCAITCDGLINSSITGGTSPYSYSWSSGETTPDLSEVCPGTYTLTVVDANGCSIVATASLGTPAALLVTTTITDETTSGAMDGSAMATTSGGEAPYTYEWSNGATTASINNLAPANYCVTVTDANDCFVVSCGIVNAGDCDLFGQVDTADPQCFGECNGSININLTGGTAPFSFNWSNGETTQGITDLCSGAYVVTITDANDCSLSISETVFVSQMTATAIITDPSDPGQTDGSIDLSNDGGSSPYTYEWSSGQSTQDIANLGPGTYCVTITDGNGCTLTDCWDISECAIVIQNPIVTVVQCNDLCDASIDITPSGGIPPYTFIWSTGATTEDIFDLCAGFYSLTVTDASDCSGSISFTITEPAAFVYNLINVTDDTGGQGIGSIDIEINGGSAPYMYEWTFNGAVFSNDQNISGLSMGDYAVIVTDANGCTVASNPIMVGDLISVDDLSNGALEVFPNPSRDLVHIHFDVPLSAEATIVLYSFNGRVTDTGLFTQKANGDWELDMSGLAVGVYTIGVIDGAERWWTRVIRI